MSLEPFFMLTAAPGELAGASAIASAVGVAFWRHYVKKDDQNQANAISYVQSVNDLTNALIAQTRTIEAMAEQQRKEKA